MAALVNLAPRRRCRFAECLLLTDREVESVTTVAGIARFSFDATQIRLH